ncbi:MAG: dockerin type I repeat-containing protein [Clostridia bacterium]|nr:dockerin type I repeat-containing protein [Clostridia bacterium]
MFKKLISFFVAAMMVLSLIPASAFAAKTPAAESTATAAKITANDGEDTRQINTNHIAIDNDPAGGYTGNYVVIYNPSESSSDAKSTGNMSGLIQTSISANMMPGEGEEKFIENDGLYRIDVDAFMEEETRKHENDKVDIPSDTRTSYNVGDTKTFTISYYSPLGTNSVEFRVLTKTAHCYVWTPTSTNSNVHPLTSADAQSAANAFESKYALMQSSFGIHNPGSSGDGRVHILYYNIDDGWNGSGGYTGGYFYGGDYNTNGLPMLHIDTYPSVYYSNYTVADTYNTIVHEYQHMIHRSRTGGYTETWINECMSAAAEELCYPGSSIFDRIMYYTDCPWTYSAVTNPASEYATVYDNLHKGYSMYAWDNNLGDILALYAQVSLFAQYLYTQYPNGNEVFNAILTEIANGKNFQQACPTVFGVSASRFVRDFRITLTTNATQNILSGKYGWVLQSGYDPNEYYGIQNPYNILGPIIFTANTCSIKGGGAITVKPVNGVYNPPAGADPNLEYYGITLNAPADVPPTEPGNDYTLDEALNVEGGELHFESTGNYPWVTAVDGDRIYAKSGNTGVDSSDSVLSTVITANAGDRVSFEFKAWGEGTSTYWDYCEFAIDGERLGYWGAYQNDWETYTTEPLTAGEHTLTWKYHKDSSVNNPGDCFMVDNVEYVPYVPTLDEALNPEGGTQHFESEGTYPWVTVIDGDRIYAKSGNAGVDSSTSELTTYFYSDGYMGVGFEFKAWGEGTEPIWDKCEFLVDGVAVATWGALQNDEWGSYVSDYLEAGEHILTWRYTKDSSVNNPGDCFMVDNVAFFAGMPEPPVQEYIDAVDILDLVIPEYGAAPVYTVNVPEDAHYTVDRVEWVRTAAGGAYLLNNDPNAVFDDPDATYVATIVLTPDEDYLFANEVAATINGEQNLVDAGEHYYGQYLVVSVGFTVEEPEPEIIDTIEILGFTEPVIGEHPDFDVSVPEDAHYTVTDVYWYNISKASIDEDFVFVPGTYYAAFNIEADEGYCFSDNTNDTTVLINGSSELYLAAYSSVSEEGTVFHAETMELVVEEPDEPELIDTIEINDFVVPEWGANPFYGVTVPEGAHYSIEQTAWFRVLGDDDEIMEGTDVFDNEACTYYMGFGIVPDEGYTFADEPTITINGDDALVYSYFWNIERTILSVCTVIFTVEPPEPVPTLLGDVDLDGNVDAADALLALRYVMGLVDLTEEQLAQAEVNGDGEITMMDCLLILRKVIGVIGSFPIEEP